MTVRGALTPVESGAPRVAPYGRAAGGLKAVAVSARYALRHAGVRRSLRVLLNVNQDKGFDCPSCAWPDPASRATAEFCENGAKAVADEATTRRVGPAFFAAHSIARLAAESDHWLNAQGRLTHPMVRRPGDTHYSPVSWDDAFGLIATELAALDDPAQATFYTSGRTSNEAAFLYQLFVRQLGHANLPDCSNMCHESSGTGLGETLGTGKGTVDLADFDHADAIFIIGQNPGTNHPRMLSTLREARRRGARIVAINPLREPGLMRFRHPQKVGDFFGKGSEIADVYLQVKVGGDLALLKGINKAIIEAGGVDSDFVARHTSGYDALAKDLAALDWDEVTSESGVSQVDIRAAADIAVASRATIACWAMGITQHKHGVANVQEIVNFLLLRGMLGRPGAGACPVRGHSNVQGDRTMGIWEHAPAWLDQLGAEFGFDPPRTSGHDTVGSIEAMLDGRVRVFFAMGGNFLSATPDTEATARALARTRLTAHVATKLSRAHLITGEYGLILPCFGRTEADPAGFVTVEDSMSVVHRSQGVLPPAADSLRSEVGIVCGLAARVLAGRSTVDWAGFAADYDKIRDAIARVVPGFSDFNRRVREPNGFVLPNAARKLSFATVDEKARFTVSPVPRLWRDLPAGQLLMTTIRTHDQFNTVIYGLDDRYRGVYGHRRVVLMNGTDIAARGLIAGEKVTLISHFAGERRHAPSFVVVPYDIPAGCVATYFPEANVLVPLGSYADKSRTPTSKSVAITVEKEEELATS